MNESALYEESKRRYPGLRSFDVGQQGIYYGRTRETTDLFDLTKIESATILYSRSGLGKSSLLNAGLLPKLQEAGYWPIRIRFQKQRQAERKDDNQSSQADEQPVAADSPITIVINTLRTEFETAYKAVEAAMAQLPSSPDAADAPAIQQQKDDGARLLANVDYVEGKGYVTNQTILFNSEKPRLWEYVKIHPFPHAIGVAFLFDQFEEFFAYTVAQRNEFLLQLAELLHDRPPTRVINWMMNNTSYDPSPEQLAWGSQPLLKCVFAIRSDRLFEMDSLKQYIPLVFRNRYELSPLRESAAREAIEEPARQPGDFYKPAFTYKPETLSLIIQTLQDKNTEIDSSQLQMVCNYIEMQVLPDMPVDEHLIPNEQKIKDIIDEYYNRQLNSLKNEADIQLAGYVLEEYFVVKGQRVGIEEAVLLTYLENRSEIIEQLMNVRLIRSETTTRGTYSFELSHDKLIDPIEKAKSKRDPDRYYRNRLALLKNDLDIDLACKVLEEHFVERSQRVAVTKANLLTYLKNRVDLIQQLNDARLIHPTTLNAQAAYELEHEMLIEPVEKANEKRQEANNRKKIIQELEDERKARTRQLRYKNALAMAIIVCLLFLLIGAYYLSQNRVLRQTATSILATQQYDIGKQYTAYRLWQDLDTQQQQTDQRLLSPFSGLNTQADLLNPNLPYVASTYRDNTLEVWQEQSEGPFEKIIDRVVQYPTSFRLKNKRLALAEGDSLLQVIDLTTKKKIFPTGPKRYRLLTTNTLRARSPSTKSVPIPAMKTLLSPRAKWIVAIDSINLVHLYRLAKSPKEHPFFQDFVNIIQESGAFTLDMVSFSVNDDFILLKNPTQNTYYLFDLRREAPPAIYTDVFQASFSPTGNYATFISPAGQLTILALGSGTVRYTSPSGNAVLVDLAYTKQDAALIMVIRQPGVAAKKNSAPNPPLFTIYTIDLLAGRPVLKTMVEQVVAYQLFGWAGRVVATSKYPNQSYSYTVVGGAKTRCPFDNFTTTGIGKTYMVYTKSYPSADKNQYLYDVVQNRKVKVTSFMEDSSGKTFFYAPPDGKDEQLISLSPQKLTLIDLNKSGKSGKWLYYQTIRAKGIPFVPTSLTIAGPIIKVRRQDGILLSFFADNQKNKPLFLEQHIYPQLSENDKRKLGLIN